jgi:hypothetical protein
MIINHLNKLDLKTTAFMIAKCLFVVCYSFHVQFVPVKINAGTIMARQHHKLIIGFPFI